MKEFIDEWDKSNAKNVLGPSIFNSSTNKLYAALHPITLGRPRTEGSFSCHGYVFEWEISNLKEAKLPLDELTIDPVERSDWTLSVEDMSNHMTFDLNWDPNTWNTIDDSSANKFINTYGVSTLNDLEDEIREIEPHTEGYLQGDLWKFEIKQNLNETDLSNPVIDLSTVDIELWNADQKKLVGVVPFELATRRIVYGPEESKLLARVGGDVMDLWEDEVRTKKLTGRFVDGSTTYTWRVRLSRGDN